MMEFLYFPKDKMEYIPAFIMLVIFMIGAVAAMYFIYKKSKKDEHKFKEQYKDIDVHQYEIDEKQNKNKED